MLKNIFSIILLIVFANFIVAPTIISMVDNTADVYMLFSLSEEEKKESIEIQEIELTHYTSKEITNCDTEKESTSEYVVKNYNPFSIQLPLPPPEHLTV